jgi:hypothetical protein
VLVSTHDESSVAHVTGARRIAVDKGEVIFDSAAVMAAAGVEA